MYPLKKILPVKFGIIKSTRTMRGRMFLNASMPASGSDAVWISNSAVDQSVLDQPQSRRIIVNSEKRNAHVVFGHQLYPRATVSLSVAENGPPNR